jgi:hypothetical protein
MNMMKAHRQRVALKEVIHNLRCAYPMDEVIAVCGTEITVGDLIASIDAKMNDIPEVGPPAGSSQRRVPVEYYKPKSSELMGRRTQVQESGRGLRDSASTDHNVDKAILQRAASKIATGPLPD